MVFVWLLNWWLKWHVFYHYPWDKFHLKLQFYMLYIDIVEVAKKRGPKSEKKKKKTVSRAHK